MLWALVAASGCGGCAPLASLEPANSPATQEPKLVPLDILIEPEPLRQSNRWMELAGELDGGNRYVQAVMVTALLGQEEVMRCSGAAISRRVVATAGHCVCKRRQQGLPGGGSQSVIDTSECYEAARVETVVYEPGPDEEITLRAASGTVQSGHVQPHPALKVVLNAQGHVSSSHADLALILLSRPLEFSGLPLASDEVKIGDSVLIAGYEYDETIDTFGRERRFSLNQVSRLRTAEDERVLIRQPGGHLYRLDSGGPCLLQGAKGPELAGISNRWLGEGTAFTSIHPYRDWLREAVQRAEAAPSVQK